MEEEVRAYGTTTEAQIIFTDETGGTRTIKVVNAADASAMQAAATTFVPLATNSETAVINAANGGTPTSVKIDRVETTRTNIYGGE